MDWLFCLIKGHQWDEWWISLYDDFANRHRNCLRCHKHQYEKLKESATIGGWHTVYIGTPNDPNTALGYDNDPAKAAAASWRKYDRLIAEMRKES